mmetsp:Transcript_29794/g.36779  ORF Transcript_29794/g.36779 Transcript_29794/m.36779 type:complete len:191 (+) Transcript_29794:75-647(+)
MPKILIFNRMDEAFEREQDNMQQEEIERVHVYGFAGCGYHNRASDAAFATFEKNKVDSKTFPSRGDYQTWLKSPDGIRTRFGKYDSRAKNHTSSPFVWVQMNGKETYIGGCDELLGALKLMKQNDTAAEEGYDIIRKSLTKYAQFENLPEEGKPAPTFSVLTLDGTKELDLLKDIAHEGRPLVLSFGSCS